MFSTCLITMPVALVLMLYATTIPSTIEPLVPALQNNLLLTVACASVLTLSALLMLAAKSAIEWRTRRHGE